MTSPIIADGRSQSPLELAEIIAAFVAASGGKTPTADGFMTGSASASGAGEFPTTVERTVRRCGKPANDLQRHAEQFVCKAGTGEYLELTAAAYGWWSPVEDPRAPGSESYRDRTDAFTIARLRDALGAAGYRDFGVISPQSSDHGFVTPLVHSAFRRDEAGPVVIAGHRPETSGDPAAARPAIMELRFYFAK
jgi:hypothetical protein